MNRIESVITKNLSQGRKSFIPYLTIGDPSLEASRTFVNALIRSGADVIELGVPYSDPVADGPTNIKAAQRALNAGSGLSRVLDFSKAMREEGASTPFVLFTYFNPLLRMGLETFARRAALSGIDGVLIVDLPPEEAAGYLTALRKEGVGTVFLASPTTEVSRLQLIGDHSTSFVYYVSRTGVTGAQNQVSQSLAKEVGEIRKVIKKPLAVGFGISSAAQATEVAKVADAVVVGSALVKIIETGVEKGESTTQISSALEAFATSLAQAIR